MVRLSTPLLASIALLADSAFCALEVNLDDPESIKSAAELVVKDLLTFYQGNQPGRVPGILPGPPPDGDYYWWQGGAMWGAILDYRWHTGDTQFDDLVTQAMLHQASDTRDFMHPNWTASMGNDDQAFWAYSALIAAETGYTDPPAESPQWLSLAQAVFNEQTNIDRRISDGGNCDWGLRWQVFASNNGYKYVNTVANACYFNMGARLARYTNNETYAELAGRSFDLIKRLGYISDEWDVYDGAHEPACTDINKAQFSYNAAMLLQGAAHLYNWTGGEEIWKTRVNGLIDSMLEDFFPQNVAFEPSCEPQKTCNKDMESFKGFMHRWMAQTTQLVPETYNKIYPVLKQSAQAAVAQCTGGDNGRMCGFHWTSGAFDGEVGATQQMSVLGALLSLLTPSVRAPLTSETGGSSAGDANAGQDSTGLPTFAPITTGDRAGAGILTALLIAGSLSAFAWMSIDS